MGGSEEVPSTSSFLALRGEKSICKGPEPGKQAVSFALRTSSSGLCVLIWTSRSSLMSRATPGSDVYELLSLTQVTEGREMSWSWTDPSKVTQWMCNLRENC